MKLQILFVFLLYIQFLAAEYAPSVRLKKYSSHKAKSMSKAINETLCQEQLDFFHQSFKRNEIWALLFFDSWSKIQSGYFAGNYIDLGDYDQCIKFQLPTTHVGTIKGKQCYMSFEAIPEASITEHDNAINSSFDWTVISRIARFLDTHLINSICMPASCSVEQIIDFMNNDFRLLEDFIVDGTCMELDDVTGLQSVDVALILIFGVSIMLMLLSTIYDLFMHQKSKEPNKLLISFSVYTNGKKLFDMTENKSTINSLHGLRALSIIWIMFGHRITNQLGLPYRNNNELFEFYQQWYSVIVYAYSIAVDTFFLMGALLLTMSTLRAIEKNNLNILRMIFHRYLRYTPVLGVAVLCTIALPRYCTGGPLEFGDFREKCVDYWWSALLHVQNYVNPDKLCLNHTWYLSVDFQLFVISPFLICGIKKYAKLILIIPVLVILCSIYIFMISIVFDVHKTPRTYDEGEIYHRWIYHPTHARIQSWLIGMSLGYLLHNKRNEKVKVNCIIDSCLLIISILVLIVIILSAHIFSTPYISSSSTILSNAIYMSLHRIGWALALAYIIFSCENQRRGSIIRWFLSHPYWKPIGTMGLSLYITHLIYMMFTMMNTKQVPFFSFWTTLHTFSGDLFPCILIATFFYLAFETPYLLIENYFYKKFNKTE
ncbi:nose resistant to fluoxetine protein 6-like [Chironomus tepperi]|uniref:nose resistant to fluoxetine protein 6-like n=1 Tax=Chironomus tepperi TaxID=113505 RepID=UPI00391EFA30